MPASWVDPKYVRTVEPTDDGPYVRHSGLTPVGQNMITSRAVFQVAEFATADTVAAEAAMYLLVNGGGTPQTDQDMAAARQVAEKSVARPSP
ncbi:hypothetical protein [Streptomyces sp. XH2]|uniref:hypothetical protein n=1 Tax=Streptomyces sp. XH2 TaxID=3412483 RepID=UPI003C7A6644